MTAYFSRAALIALSASAFAVSVQASLLSWTASNFAAFSDPAAPSFDSDFTDASVQQSTLTRGSSLAPSDTFASVFGATGYSTSLDLATAQGEGSFWEFAVTPETGEMLDFTSLDVNIGTNNTFIFDDGGFEFVQGPSRLALGYSFSADPATDLFVPIAPSPDIILRNTEGTVREIAGITNTEWDLTFLQSIQTTVYFRLYLFGATDSLAEAFIGTNGGTSPLVGPPDLSVNGVGTPVPEPAGIAALMGLAALAVTRFRRRRKSTLVTE
ncbi:MAG: PEP-CTERM sorting domain-containing protein [Opitutales bacterium]